MIKVLFICHGNIPKSPQKASKINGFTEQKGAYYTTTTPFFERALMWQEKPVEVYLETKIYKLKLFALKKG